MIRAAIVGCGKMADQHAVQIRKIPGAALVAACDAEPLMARQLAERFAIPASYRRRWTRCSRPRARTSCTSRRRPRATWTSGAGASRAAPASTSRSRSR